MAKRHGIWNRVLGFVCRLVGYEQAVKDTFGKG